MNTAREKTLKTTAIAGLNLQTLNDRVIVLPDPDEKQTKSGILLPDNAQKKRVRIGTVVAAGEEYKDYNSVVHKIPVSVGQRVMYMEYAGQEFQYGEAKYISLCHLEILCIVERSDSGYLPYRTLLAMALKNDEGYKIAVRANIITAIHGGGAVPITKSHDAADRVMGEIFSL